MNIRALLAWFMCVGILFSCGCKPGSEPLQFDEAQLKKVTSDYDRAIQSGINGKFYPAEFNRLFPGASNAISYYAAPVGNQKWTSSAALFHRYRFSMHHIIELDRSKTNIVAVGPPEFHLYEVTQITTNANGSLAVYDPQIATFSLDKWRQLVAAKGDFGVLGISLKTNEPVPNFDVTWDRIR